jgi:hypothetical protein
MAVALLSFSVKSYRFVCNGMLANGESRSDECGKCDDETAARWENSNVAVVTDDAGLPETISKDEWRQIIDESIAAWNNIPGSSFNFLDVGESNLREFGANESVHEIFWINTKEEWNILVGGGELGTLGATMPRYLCKPNSDGPRKIFDADLVLNGLPHINWQLDCDDDDCIDPRTTLVHELGHFFGLDHPCLSCSSSIMSARAGFDLILPVFDDIEGVTVLYPSENFESGFGTKCEQNEDCSSQQCITQGAAKYCSDNCSNDIDCTFGGLCTNYLEESKVCMFPDGESAGGRLEGESCVKAPCVEGLICAGPSEEQYFCFATCSSNDQCEESKSCFEIELNISICLEFRFLKNQNKPSKISKLK